MAFLNPQNLETVFTAVSELLDREHLDLHADDRTMLEGAHKLLAAAKDGTAPQALRDAADSKYGSTDVEIDDEAAASFGDGGAWVAAWVWMVDRDCGQCDGTGETESASNGECEECPVCEGSGSIGWEA